MFPVEHVVSRDLCPSRPNTEGTYIYSYYFHRGKVLTSRPTLVGRLLLLPWLVYREYPPGAGRSPFTQQCIHSGILRGPPHSYRVHSCGIKEPVQGPLMLLLHTASSRAWRLEKPYQRVRLAGPPLGKRLSIGLPWRPSWRRQPSCWQSPFGYYRSRAAGRICPVHGLVYTSGRDAAPPQNTLSGVKCVAFSVAVSM